MKILYVADLHLSHNPPPARSTTPFWQIALGKVQRLIDEHRPDSVVCGGDLFHSRAKARPNVGVQTLLALRKVIDEGPPWHVVPGNHDLAFDTTEQGWLSPLRLLESEHCKVYWTPTYADFYPSDGTSPILAAMVPYCGLDLPEMSRVGTRLAFVHAPITPTPNPFFESLSPKQVATLYPSARLVVTGHVHEPFDVTTVDQRLQRVVCPGSLVRRGRDELLRPTVNALLISDGPTCETLTFDGVDDVLPDMLATADFDVDVEAIVGQGGVEFRPLDVDSVRADLRKLTDDEDVVELAVGLFERALAGREDEGRL